MAISSPGKYGLASCFLIEVLATFFFLYGHHLEGRGGRICRDTDRALPDPHSPLPHPGHQRLCQPGTKHRSGVVCWAYIGQLWLFWLAPILGAAIAGVVARWQHDVPDAT
jgi:aquaporin Z